MVSSELSDEGSYEGLRAVTKTKTKTKTKPKTKTKTGLLKTLPKKKTPNLVLLHTQRSGRRSLQHNRKRRGSKSRIDQGKGDVPQLVLLALVIIAQQSQRRKQ